jgi:hypothetical protein
MTIAKQNSRKSESVSSKTGFLKREVRSGSSNAQFFLGDDWTCPGFVEGGRWRAPAGP